MATTREISAAIEAFNERLESDELDEDFEDEYGEEVFAEALQYADSKTIELPEVGIAHFVEYEHINEDLFLIFRIEDTFYRITGYYSSYDADEWESDVDEVVPEEKVITVYTSVKRG